MSAQLTAVFRRVPEGFVGRVEEIPGANVQEATLDEARESLAEAVRPRARGQSRAGASGARRGDRRDPGAVPARPGGVKRRDLIRHLEAHGERAARGGEARGLREPGRRADDDGAAARRDQRISGAQDLPRSGDSGAVGTTAREGALRPLRAIPPPAGTPPSAGSCRPGAGRHTTLSTRATGGQYLSARVAAVREEGLAPWGRGGSSRRGAGRRCGGRA